MRQFTRLVLAFSAVSLLAACGGGNNGSGDTGGDDTGQVEDTGQMDAGMDTGADTMDPSEDTGGNDTGGTDTSNETCLEAEDSDAIPLNSFQYYEQDQGGSSTKSGVGVSLSGQNLQITKIEPGSPNCPLDCADAKEIRNNLLDQSVRKKMKNSLDKDVENDGWKCGSQAKIGAVEYKFEAQLGTTFDDPGQTIANVSGCIPDDASGEDAATVQNIADTLMNMRETYFKERDCHSSG